jgi:hypothetical protein
MTRRHFLQSAAVAATVLPALAQGGSARRIRKGIMWGTVGVPGSVLEKMQAVKAAGFEGVEPMGGMDNAEVNAALAATGLKAGSVCCHTHWAKPLSDPNPAVREVGVEGLKLSLRDAKAYGAPAVLLVPAVVNASVRKTSPLFSAEERISFGFLRMISGDQVTASPGCCFVGHAGHVDACSHCMLLAGVQARQVCVLCVCRSLRQRHGQGILAAAPPL